jgi:hypothetical protein
MLLPQDFESTTWMRFRQFAIERLEELRQRNDGDLDEAETQRVRGQIAELKHWLALDHPTPTLEPSRPD